MSSSTARQTALMYDPWWLASRQEGLRLFVLVIAIGSICMAIGGYIGYVRLGVAVPYPVLLSPYFSTAVLLCGGALYWAQARPQHAVPLGIVVMGLIIASYIAAQRLDAWQNGPNVSAVLVSAVVLVGVLAALFLDPLEKGGMNLRRKGTAGLAVLGVSVSAALAYGLLEDQIIAQQRYSALAAEAAAAGVEDRFAQTRGMMQRMAGHWGEGEQLRPQAFIDREFDSSLRDFPFIDSMMLVNAENVLVAAVTRRAKDTTGSRQPPVDFTSLDGIKKVRARNEVSFFVDEATASPRTTLWSAVPLRSAGLTGGLLIAQIDLAKMLEPSLSRLDGAPFRVGLNGKAIDQPMGWLSAQALDGREASVSISPELVLTFSYPTERGAGQRKGEVLPELIFLAGMLCTFALLLAQHLSNVVRERSARFRNSALHDPLTRLPNRRMLEQTLREASTRPNVKPLPISVVFLDLDSIKLINDTLGHDLGDAVLVEVAQRLRSNVKDDAEVGRFDGDEFVLMFFGYSPEHVQALTQRVISRLSGPYQLGNRVLRVSVSAGIASTEDGSKDPLQLFREADLAMLAAKQKGRNNWHVYTADLSEQVAERLALHNDLQMALEEEQLTLYYQPIISGHSGRVVGVEALLRWLHPQRGFISPANFIPAAEQSGQIIPLTDWVLATACRDGRELRDRGAPICPVIVNISPLCFQRSGFVQSIHEALDQAGLPPEWLEIEITEGVWIDSEEDTILKLEQLRNMGLKTSIDDFGTGYSSLSYLKMLPIDKVKIDRSFIIGLAEDPADAAIVRGIMSMAHHLGLKVVAEGVETEAQLLLLARSHCDQFQGYLLARPMPFDALKTVLFQKNFRLRPPLLLSEPETERVLLLVGSANHIQQALVHLLSQDGYRILSASTPAQAFDLLARHAVQVIVCQQGLSEMTGIMFFSRIKSIYPSSMRMILSYEAELGVIKEAVNDGAIYKFLTYPWDDMLLRKDVEQAFVSHRVQGNEEMFNRELECLGELFRLAPGFVCMLRGPQHIFELANEAYYACIGPRQIIGRGVAEVIPELVEQGYLQKLDHVFATGEPFVGRDLPVQLRHESAGTLQHYYVDLVYQPIHDAWGQVSGIFVQGHVSGLE